MWRLGTTGPRRRRALLLPGPRQVEQAVATGWQRAWSCYGPRVASGAEFSPSASSEASYRGAQNSGDVRRSYKIWSQQYNVMRSCLATRVFGGCVAIVSYVLLVVLNTIRVCLAMRDLLCALLYITTQESTWARRSTHAGLCRTILGTIRWVLSQGTRFNVMGCTPACPGSLHSLALFNLTI